MDIFAHMTIVEGVEVFVGEMIVLTIIEDINERGNQSKKYKQQRIIKNKVNFPLNK